MIRVTKGRSGSIRVGKKTLTQEEVGLIRAFRPQDAISLCEFASRRIGLEFTARQAEALLAKLGRG